VLDSSVLEVGLTGDITPVRTMGSNESRKGTVKPFVFLLPYVEIL